MSVEWSWQRAADSLPILIDGFKITLLATVLGMAIASVLGLVIAIARRTCPAYVRVPLRWITEFIRLTPLVVQLLFVYYLLPQFSALQIGIAVLGVHYSTYMAEVYRAGIEAVPAGQWEAARALSSSDDENVASCGSSAGCTRHPTGAGKLRDFHVQGHTVPLRNHGGRIGHRCTAIRSSHLSISGADHDGRSDLPPRQLSHVRAHPTSGETSCLLTRRPARRFRSSTWSNDSERTPCSITSISRSSAGNVSH